MNYFHIFGFIFLSFIFVFVFVPCHYAVLSISIYIVKCKKKENFLHFRSKYLLHIYIRAFEIFSLQLTHYSMMMRYSNFLKCIAKLNDCRMSILGDWFILDQLTTCIKFFHWYSIIYPSSKHIISAFSHHSNHSKSINIKLTFILCYTQN